MEPICTVIEFPVSTYYAAKKREDSPSDRELRDEELVPLIREVWETKGKRLYGARKVWRQLRRDGVVVAQCTVERLMRDEGVIGAVARRRRPRTTIPGEQSQRPRDLVGRDFRAPAPNQLWVTDITYGGWRAARATAGIEVHGHSPACGRHCHRNGAFSGGSSYQ